MTLKSIKEYVTAIRERYQRSNKKEKGKILDEFEKVTGYHRKAAIRLLVRTPKPAGKHRGRPGRNNGVLRPLITIWSKPGEDFDEVLHFSNFDGPGEYRDAVAAEGKGFGITCCWGVSQTMKKYHLSFADTMRRTIKSGQCLIGKTRFEEVFKLEY